MFKYSLVIFFGVLVISCKSNQNNNFDRFPEGKSKENINVDGIDVKNPELELQLFAQEPDVINPTNIAIDSRGRVWVCEAYNYRNGSNNVPYKSQGDKISILEDTNGDGKSDKKTIFYEGEDVNAALGIAVLGTKVIVSCSPNVLVFEDTNKDDVPDSKNILFKTKGGYQSDHGIHSFFAGPDSKLYFNFGNHAEGLTDKNGNTIKDIFGREIDQTRAPFQDGMAIRCDIEGKYFEVLGWNFRNNYELTVDAFGRIWQSDNDDDGVRGNRINYILKNGNYGYKDEKTGADWRVNRSNIEDSIFLRHWHQNDPGVVPNLYQTFAGSPTGIVFNEWNGLGNTYQNTIILADAGTNEVNAYTPTTNGGGYKLEKIPLLNSAVNDKWFRPSDVAFAPDGSLFIADWYDTGVGGHYIGDLEKGRIYRLAKKGINNNPKVNLDKPENVIANVSNPNSDVRFDAINKFRKLSPVDIKYAQGKLKIADENQIARLSWLINEIDSSAVKNLIASKSENLRILASKLVPKSNLTTLAGDPSDAVRASVGTEMYQKTDIISWLKLTQKYIPNDKWSLEAIGIAAEGKWDAYLKAYIDKTPNWRNNPAALDIIWRSRAMKSSELLSEIISKKLDKNTEKYFRAIDFQEKNQKNKVLISLLKNSADTEIKLSSLRHFDVEYLKNDQQFNLALNQLLPHIKKQSDLLEVIEKYELKDQKNRLFTLLDNPNSDKPTKIKVAQVLTNMFGVSPIKESLNLPKASIKFKAQRIADLAEIDNEVITKQLINIFMNKKQPFEIREAAMLGMVGYGSDLKLWQLLNINKIPKDLLAAAKKVFEKTYHNDLKVAFEQRFGNPKIEKLNSDLSFLKLKGDTKKGMIVFNNYCATCHKIYDNGADFGPGLSNIGTKLTKEAIYNAIAFPSQGISFGYENYNINYKDGSTQQGLITSKTSDSYLIKQPGSAEQISISKSKVKSVDVQKTSIMPAFQLQNQEYADLITYLYSLK